MSATLQSRAPLWRFTGIAGLKRVLTQEQYDAQTPDIKRWYAPVPVETFQSRVQPWLHACFGPEISADITERNHRFLEEALELVQSTGCTRIEAHQLVDYVFGRPVGDPPQEVGGVMVTLAALCLALGLDMHEAGEVELARIWTKVEQIRAKQAAKPQHSPLPGPSEPQRAAAGAAPPDAATLVGLWFGEWELILPPDAREAFRNDLLPSVRTAGMTVDAPAPGELEALSREVDALPGAIRPSAPWPRTSGVPAPFPGLKPAAGGGWEWRDKSEWEKGAPGVEGRKP